MSRSNDASRARTARTEPPPADDWGGVITDTHTHLYWDELASELDSVLLRARASGVGRMVVVGTDLATSRAAFELCRGHAQLHPTAGVHPHDAAGLDEAVQAEIEALCTRDECVAVGETGLDWFKNLAPREAQMESFAWHARLARRLAKPLVVHCRDAHEDTLAVLRDVPGVRGVMHCYTLGPTELDAYLALGFAISFAGVVTYPKNEHVREAARLVPLESILFETDCPFLPPQSRRGSWPNEPSGVRETIEHVARVRGIDARELAQIASANAARVFGLAPLA